MLGLLDLVRLIFISICFLKAVVGEYFNLLQDIEHTENILDLLVKHIGFILFLADIVVYLFFSELFYEPFLEICFGFILVSL